MRTKALGVGERQIRERAGSKPGQGKEAIFRPGGQTTRAQSPKKQGHELIWDFPVFHLAPEEFI